MNLCRSNNFVIKSMLLGSIIGAAIFIWTRDKYKKEEEIIPSPYYNEGGPVKDNMVSSMKRNKRFLIYSGSGVVKVTYPCDM